MSDLGETFAGHREESQLRRASHRATSPAMLERNGISFTSHNDGAHLVVEERFDFWPGTGLFIERSSSKRGRGVRLLIKRVRS